MTNNTQQKEEQNAPLSTANAPNEPSKNAQKRLKQYQSLGFKSKTQVEARKFSARSTSFERRSMARRKHLSSITEFDRFCELLCVENKLLNTANFLDFLAGLINVYTGSNQIVSVRKLTANTHPQTHQHIA